MPQHCVPARRCRRHRVVMKRRPPYGLRRCRLAKYFKAASIRQLLESSPFINWVQVPGCLVFYIHITRATHGSLSFWLPQVLPGTYRHVSIFGLEIFSVHKLITYTHQTRIHALPASGRCTVGCLAFHRICTSVSSVTILVRASLRSVFWRPVGHVGSGQGW